MTVAMGAGAIAGGFFAAARGQIGLRSMMKSSALFAVVLVLAAIAPALRLELKSLA